MTHVLACNAGSSSLKLSLFAGSPAQGWALVNTVNLPASDATSGHASYADMLSQWLQPLPVPEQILHRVVHAGLVPEQAAVLNDSTIADIRHWLPMAPRHNALTLELISALQQRWPHLPQFAIYDSGLYANLPVYAARYALPDTLSEDWPLRRYGFHGLAHRSQWRQVQTMYAEFPWKQRAVQASGQLPADGDTTPGKAAGQRHNADTETGHHSGGNAQPDVGYDAMFPGKQNDNQRLNEQFERLNAPGEHRAFSEHRAISAHRAVSANRVISVHLGSGVSVTAWHDGAAVDTSMGFSPLEGLIMARRSGSVDPGLLMHLLLRGGITPSALDSLLHEHSGLAALAGHDGDMRLIIQELAGTGSDSAAAAIKQYCYQIRKTIGSYIAALGGVDAISFGGGVAEHQPLIRQQILAGLDGLGIVVDCDTNNALTTAGAFHAAQSACALYLTPVNEMDEMLRQYEVFAINN